MYPDSAVEVSSSSPLGGAVGLVHLSGAWSRWAVPLWRRDDDAVA